MQEVADLVDSTEAEEEAEVELAELLILVEDVHEEHQ